APLDPLDLAVAPDGTAYVLGATDDRIVRLTLAGGVEDVGVAPVLPGSTSNASTFSGLAARAGGLLYAMVPAMEGPELPAVYVLDAQGRIVQTLGAAAALPEPLRPTDIEVAADGTVLLLEAAAGRVRRLSPRDGQVTTVALGSMPEAYARLGVTVDGSLVV